MRYIGYHTPALQGPRPSVEEAVAWSYARARSHGYAMALPNLNFRRRLAEIMCVSSAQPMPRPKRVATSITINEASVINTSLFHQCRDPRSTSQPPSVDGDDNNNQDEHNAYSSAVKLQVDAGMLNVAVAFPMELEDVDGEEEQTPVNDKVAV
jgi:hypothetical protein